MTLVLTFRAVIIAENKFPVNVKSITPYLHSNATLLESVEPSLRQSVIFMMQSSQIVSEMN